MEPVLNSKAALQVKHLMMTLGVSCHTVDNGQAAIQALTTEPDRYDMVLMDCNMPVMDGWGLACESQGPFSNPCWISRPVNSKDPFQTPVGFQGPVLKPTLGF